MSSSAPIAAVTLEANNDAATRNQHQVQLNSAVSPPQRQASTAWRCLICFSDAKTSIANGRTPCQHNEMCGTCLLKLRHLHADTKCPICKTSNEMVIVDTINQNDKRFEDYPLWGEDLGRDFFFLKGPGLFFPVGYYQSTILPLLSYVCNFRDCTFGHFGAVNVTAGDDAKASTTTVTSTSTTNTTLRQLQDHLRKEHRLTLCTLCIEHKRDFVARLPRYAPSGLQRHLEHTSSGHPLCEFCRPTRFYDLTALHVHLNHEHYKCHVCEQQGLPNQFFRHYPSLEKHFEQRHFLCPDPQCMAARFMVFANELDLHAHQRQVHGGSSSVAGSTALQLEFRLVRSRQSQDGGNDHSNSYVDYSVDGTAFVPPAPLQANNNNSTSQLHPDHVARTEELRQRAMELREQHSEEEAFPTLDSSVPTPVPSSTTNNRLTIGWTADGTVQRMARQKPAGVVTEEDFPTLGGSAARSSNQRQVAAGKKPAPATSTMNAISMLQQRKPAPSNAGSGNGWTAPGSAVAAYPVQQARSITPSPPSHSNSISTLTVLRPAGAAATAAAASSSRPLDLSSSSFPSLGGGSSGARKGGATTTSTPLYGAAQAYAKATNNGTAHLKPHVAADNFPSLPSTTKSASKSISSKPPTLTAEQFPALGGSTAKTKATARQKQTATSNTTNRYSAADALAQKQARERAVSLTALSTGWNAPASASTAASTEAASVDNIKAALGPAAYKLLKQFTRDFAARDLAADAYIDHAASLFSRGYADADFWTFVPALVASCPPSADKDAAMRYMDHLQRMRNGALNAEAVLAAASAASVVPAAMAAPAPATTAGGNAGWSAAAAAASTPSFTSVNSMSSMPSSGRYVPPPPPVSYGGRLTALKQPPKNAWGSGSGSAAATPLPASVVRAKPSAMSVTGAAIASPSNTATSFMAKEAKEEQWQQQQQQQSKANNQKKKGKQKNELRALAFGS